MPIGSSSSSRNLRFAWESTSCRVYTAASVQLQWHAFAKLKLQPASPRPRNKPEILKNRTSDQTSWKRSITADGKSAISDYVKSRRVEIRGAPILFAAFITQKKNLKLIIGWQTIYNRPRKLQLTTFQSTNFHRKTPSHLLQPVIQEESNTHQQLRCRNSSEFEVYKPMMEGSAHTVIDAIGVQPRVSSREREPVIISAVRDPPPQISGARARAGDQHLTCAYIAIVASANNYCHNLRASFTAPDNTFPAELPRVKCLSRPRVIWSRCRSIEFRRCAYVCVCVCVSRVRYAGTSFFGV